MFPEILTVDEMDIIYFVIFFFLFFTFLPIIFFLVHSLHVACL
jgi:hypothetical protein